ncbi:hypothetical protein [Kineosporia sp. A_224]|uniref:hypothetical protein n=1 Tax=Kineosporia sp. A_224 TaxID=1962180 RepID=UPI000B4A95FE|nr:hypothetical protein [Kineosporia sp. A_224]
MGFSNPIIGGGGALIREAIRSPDYAPGSAGWTINRDGSAELNNVSIRGDFATGVAGGPEQYLTIDDDTDRTTVAFWNKEGTDKAYINSPLNADGNTPGLGANTGVYNISGATPGFSRLYMTGGNFVQLATVRGSDQSAFGGEFFASNSFASVRHAPLGGAHTGGEVFVDSTGVQVARNNAGSATGGRLKATTTDGVVEYASAGTGQHGIQASSSGVTSYGTFPSTIGWTFTPTTDWTTSEFRMDRWGPFVALHIFVTYSGAAALGPGNITDQTVGTIVSAGNLPKSQTSMAAQWFAGTAAVSVDSAGSVVIRYLTTALNPGDGIRFDTCYFNE